jgi:cobalt/nickel transport system permease protein
MHIPDGFLDTPVWLTLDAAALSAVAVLAKRAGRETDEARAPLMGVMGAFVFAAQMINFPVGVGTSGHLVGSALLAVTLGPASAALVMTAILVLQALIFQDGGLLALGANVINMAVVGVLAGYLPYRYWGAGASPRAALFLGGALSVFTAACLALAELLLSGIRIPGFILGGSLGLFGVTALIEGAITVAVVEALQRMNPGWIRRPETAGRSALGALAVASLVLATVGALFASALPDGLERLAERAGISGRARNLIETPLADYQAAFIDSPWPSQIAAGLTGLLLITALCLLLSRLVGRGKRA